MYQIQCPRGHVYNADRENDTNCPSCRQMDIDLTKTTAFYSHTAIVPSADMTKTIPVYHHLQAEVDPVVGWLVCISGADLGKDWRLVAGRNTIGRDSGMNVALSGDRSVSAVRHAIVSFEPRRRGFSLLPGDSRGLVYLNGEEVVSPVQLKMHDQIELGKSTLIFIPLVCEGFGWPDSVLE